MGEATLKQIDKDESYVDELVPGTTLLHGQYRINSFLNAGGFGITYLAQDSLGRKVVIKECFPNSLCHRSNLKVEARSQAHTEELVSIVQLFLQEAHSLSRMNHPNIVGVHQVFEENKTAYMVLDFIEGRDLLGMLEDPNEEMSPGQIKGILTDVLDAVRFIHSQGILHRDISPDNILLDADLRPVLIDFGAAREQASKKSRLLSAMRVVKDGYSPQEFYIQGAEQTPSSDLYALGASFYHIIAGDIPPNSQARLSSIAQGEADPYKPLVETAKGYDKYMLSSIDKALAILPKDRVQSADEWLEIMAGRRRSRVLTQPAPVSSAAAELRAEQKRKASRAPLFGTVAVVALVAVGGYAAMQMQGGDTAQLDEVVATETVAAAVAPTDAQPATSDASSAAAALASVMAAAEQAGADSTAAPELTATALSEAVGVATPNAVDTSILVPTPVDTAAAVPDLSNAGALLGLPTIETDAVAAATSAVEADVAPLVSPDASAAVPADIAALLGTQTDQGSVIDFPPLVASVGSDALIAPDADDLASAVPANMDDVIARLGILPNLPEVAPDAPMNPEVSAILDQQTSQTASLAVPQRSDILTNWTVNLPFETEEGSGRIISVAQGAPEWMQTGQEILAVNGTSVASMAEIVPVLREQIDLGSEQDITVRLATGQAEDGAWIDQEITLAVQQNTSLLNGITFVTTPEGDSWTTVVSEVPEAADSDLAVGDIVVADLIVNTLIDQRTSISDALALAFDDGRQTLDFAVNRDGAMWMASLTYTGGF